eukprot:3687611-Karenia_brevis.AAC.1
MPNPLVPSCCTSHGHYDMRHVCHESPCVDWRGPCPCVPCNKHNSSDVPRAQKQWPTQSAFWYPLDDVGCAFDPSR